MTYDPDTWDEEQLHAALSEIHLDGSSPEPRRLLRARLDELLSRPIDDAPLTLGGFPLVRGVFRDRPEHELARLPPHVLVVMQDGLTEPRFHAVPDGADPELLHALRAAHGGILGDLTRARRDRHGSVLRVGAGTIEASAVDSFYLLHVIDLSEEWEGFPVPSVDSVRAWAGALLPYRVTAIAGLDVCVVHVCAILDDV